MTFAGANASYISDFQAAGITPTGQRIYLNTASVNPGPIPPAWPNLGSTQRACVSIRPDCTQATGILSGMLDDQLMMFLGSAPGGPVSMLALWHEAGTMNYPGLNDGDLKASQQYVQAMCKSQGFGVKVGAIEVSSTPNPGNWMAKNLDFYAMDVYDNRTCDLSIDTECANFQAKANARMDNGAALIAVTETNSRCSGTRRAFWLNTVWDWMADNGYITNGNSFLTYWNPDGIESGPWLPNDTATIAALKSICAGSSP